MLKRAWKLKTSCESYHIISQAHRNSSNTINYKIWMLFNSRHCVYHLTGSLLFNPPDQPMRKRNLLSLPVQMRAVRLSQGWGSSSQTHREEEVEPESEHRCTCAQAPQTFSLTTMVLTLPLETKCIRATQSHATVVYPIFNKILFYQWQLS